MKITISELKRMVQEEMMNEAGTPGVAPKNVRKGGKPPEESSSTLKNFLIGLGLLASVAGTSYLSGKNNENAFENGLNGNLLPKVIEVYKNPTSTKNELTSKELSNALGFGQGCKKSNPNALKVQKELDIPDKDVDNVKRKLEEKVRVLGHSGEGPGDVKESRSNSRPTKITLSELKQLVRSELKRSGLV